MVCDVRIPSRHDLQRLALGYEVSRLAVHQLLHDLEAVGHVEVEALASELLGVDEVLHLDPFVPVDLEVMEVDQKQCQSR